MRPPCRSAASCSACAIASAPAQNREAGPVSGEEVSAQRRQSAAASGNALATSRCPRSKPRRLPSAVYFAESGELAQILAIAWPIGGSFQRNEVVVATDLQLGSIGELGRERARVERGVVQAGDPAEGVEEAVHGGEDEV